MTFEKILCRFFNVIFFRALFFLDESLHQWCGGSSWSDEAGLRPMRLQESWDKARPETNRKAWQPKLKAEHMCNMHCVRNVRHKGHAHTVNACAVVLLMYPCTPDIHIYICLWRILKRQGPKCSGKGGNASKECSGRPSLDASPASSRYRFWFNDVSDISAS